MSETAHRAELLVLLAILVTERRRPPAAATIVERVAPFYLDRTSKIAASARIARTLERLRAGGAVTATKSKGARTVRYELTGAGRERLERAAGDLTRFRTWSNVRDALATDAGAPIADDSRGGRGSIAALNVLVVKSLVLAGSGKTLLRSGFAATRPGASSVARGERGGESLEAFARRVREAARRTTTGRFGQRRVFISHVLRTLGEAESVAARSPLRERLLEANRKGLLRLAAADHSNELDHDDVATSLIRGPINDRYHFISVEDRHE